MRLSKLTTVQYRFGSSVESILVEMSVRTTARDLNPFPRCVLGFKKLWCGIVNKEPPKLKICSYGKLKFP
jgi:hypothetical protein